jgi:hypothetical protein
LLLQGWARQGLTDAQIAKNMRVSLTTLKFYKAQFPAILAALKEGKEVVDTLVENALLKRALGYEYTETREEREDGVLVKEITTNKQMAPDVTAQIFWLKNRRPELFRNAPRDGVGMAELEAKEQQARIDKLQAETEIAKARFELEKSLMGVGTAEDETRDNFVDMFKADAAEVWRDATKADPGEADGV